MLFEFSEITLPPIPNKCEGESFERLKSALSTTMFSQRMVVFTTQASRDGPWKPLAPATMRERLSRITKRDRRGASGAVNILVDTGVLRQSFTMDTGPGSAFKHVEIGEDFVRNSTNVPYARIQNFGGTVLHQHTKKTQMFKHYTGGEREGQIRFASKREVERGHGRDFQIVDRDITSHAMGSFSTIPARPYDQFTDENEKELAELTEAHLNGKLR